MTVKIVSGNIFETELECITDANNSVGISGAGLALAFARRYPKVAEHYNKFSKEWQAHHAVRNYGKNGPFLMPPFIYPKGYLDNKDFAICKFPSMIFPGERTSEKNIEANLKTLLNLLPMKAITSIALPALGCGIGGFSFETLQKNVEATFNDSRFLVHLYKPA